MEGVSVGVGGWHARQAHAEQNIALIEKNAPSIHVPSICLFNPNPPPHVGNSWSVCSALRSFTLHHVLSWDQPDGTHTHTDDSPGAVLGLPELQARPCSPRLQMRVISMRKPECEPTASTGFDERAFTHLSSANTHHTREGSMKKKVYFIDGFSKNSIKFKTSPVLLVVTAENREQKFTFVTF